MKRRLLLVMATIMIFAFVVMPFADHAGNGSVSVAQPLSPEVISDVV